MTAIRKCNEKHYFVFDTLEKICYIVTLKEGKVTKQCNSVSLTGSILP